MKFVFLASLVSLLLYFSPAHCQLDTTCFPTTNAYLKYVDSMYTNYSGEKSKIVKDSFYRGKSEGSISGTAINSIGDTKVNLSGGFSVSSFVGRWPKNIYYIEVHDNLLFSLTRKYYYKSNKLVYAYMELKNWEHSPSVILYRKEEYFEGNKMVSSTIINSGLQEQHHFRVNLSLESEAADKLKGIMAP